MKNKLILLSLIVIGSLYPMETDTRLLTSLRSSGLTDKDLDELTKSIGEIYTPHKRRCSLDKTCKFLAVGCLGSIMGPLMSARIHYQLGADYTGQWMADEAVAGGLISALVYDQVLMKIEKSENEQEKAALRELLKRKLGKRE